MIVKRKGGYHVLSEKGKNLGGPYKTREEAEKRLQQVEYFKHQKGVKDAAFYADYLSKHIAETPEGFLICKDVPVARTGMQEYLGQELNLMDKYDQKVKVFREPEDVFDEGFIASFEGKPVTDDHPQVFPVDTSNHHIYYKGHAQNARRSGDHIIVDLVITEPVLIDKVKSKLKREVSAGYNCKWVKTRGGYKQINMTANHIAIVDKGRAGPSVAIKDSKVEIKGAKRMNKQTAMLKMFAAFAKDAEPEEIEEVGKFVFDHAPKEKEANGGALATLLRRFAKDSEEEIVEETKEKKESKAPSMDERITGIESGMKAICDTLAELKAGKKATDSEEHADEDEDKKLIEKMLKGKEKAEDAKEDEGMEEDCEDSDEEKEDKAEDESSAEKEDSEELKKESKKEQDETAATDAMRKIVKDMAPAIAKLPKKYQDVVKDSLAKTLGRTRKGSSNQYHGIVKAVRSHTGAAKDAKQQDLTQLGKDWAAKFNPHYKKVESK